MDGSTTTPRTGGWFVDGAFEQGGVWMLDDAAVAVWIPPGGHELSEAAAAELERFIFGGESGDEVGGHRAQALHVHLTRLEGAVVSKEAVGRGGDLDPIRHA